MFTGIVEETGKVVRVEKGAVSSRLTIEGNVIFNGISLGDSIAVNGVCLTAAEIKGSAFTADVMHETLVRSSLGQLKGGDAVNLERAMAANGRFGGHIVSGHIDGTGTVTGIKPDGNALLFTIAADEHIIRLIVEKGSISIDGISLTVASVDRKSFTVSLIPHTVANTTLSTRKTGDTVNLENDIIGKYVERLMGFSQAAHKESTITMDFLSKHGF